MRIQKPNPLGLVPLRRPASSETVILFGPAPPATIVTGAFAADAPYPSVPLTLVDGM